MILIGSYLVGFVVRAKQRSVGYVQSIGYVDVLRIADQSGRTSSHAQEYPGTPMQQIADVTWADAQVYIASRRYLADRPKALRDAQHRNERLRGVIQSSKDERLTSRSPRPGPHL